MATTLPTAIHAVISGRWASRIAPLGPFLRALQAKLGWQGSEKRSL